MYNPIPDLMIMGAFILAVAAIIWVTRKKPQGATPVNSRDELIRMQQIRRMENEHVYNISGNGAAHKSAEDYLSDPKVIDQLRRMENE